MHKIERIRDLDDEVFEEFKLYFPKTTTSSFKREYPNTIILNNLFDTSGTFIKNAIFDGCENDDYYGVNILYRCLIEHFIRSQYIFINWGKTKSDEFAKDYIELNVAKETLDSIRALVSERQLYDSNFIITNWDEFLNKYPKFRSKSRKEVESETNKFIFKNIIRFLNSEFKKGKNEMSDFLGKFIIEYSNLSSYVHGGMKSYEEIMMASTEEIRTKEYERISGLSFQLSNSIKLFNLLMMVQSDRQTFSQHYLVLDKLIKQINEN